MGAIFKLEHANIMAYITSRSYSAPRVRRQDLSDFLNVFIYEPERYLISERGFELWPQEVSEIARKARSRLNETDNPNQFRDRSKDGEQTVVARIVENILEELRSVFSYYPLYAIALGRHDGLREKAYQLARMPFYGNLLVLIPDHQGVDGNFNVIDPIPAFSVGLHAAADWPGFVFWTLNGSSAFAPLTAVDELASQLDRAAHGSGRRHRGPFFEGGHSGDFDAVLRKWETGRKSSSRRLLHLSDLHFGTHHANENQAFLDAELRDVVKEVDRVVITGDLFDSPKAQYATQFNTFRNNITYLSGGQEPIAITGNHDQRIKGILGDDYEQLAKIGPSKIVVDDKCEMIFICFNSSEGGLLARGHISESQFRNLGTEYRNLLASRHELKRYLPIVLVHHHPFSFDAEPSGWLERTLGMFGLKLERTLVLKNADDLHKWCIDWKIQTILHGHKHKARYVERIVSHGQDRMSLTAIGCGSSLGAEGSPMAYNLLEWEPAKQKWVASFHESINGGAFKELAVSVSA